MAQLTFPALEQAVRAEVAEHPAYVDPRSADPERAVQYAAASDGYCGCLFGCALVRLGVLPEALDGLTGTIDYVLRRVLTVPAHSRELAWARVVQAEQDGGAAWSAAVAFADQHWPIHDLEGENSVWNL